jgi:hypothetical protein
MENLHMSLVRGVGHVLALALEIDQIREAEQALVSALLPDIPVQEITRVQGTILVQETILVPETIRAQRIIQGTLDTVLTEMTTIRVEATIKVVTPKVVTPKVITRVILRVEVTTRAEVTLRVETTTRVIIRALEMIIRVLGMGTVMLLHLLPVITSPQKEWYKAGMDWQLPRRTPLCRKQLLQR